MKTLLVHYINSNTKKILPVTQTQSCVPDDSEIFYHADGWLADFDKYKKVNKDLPWDKIEKIINTGFKWVGSEYGNTAIQMQLYR